MGSANKFQKEAWYLALSEYEKNLLKSLIEAENKLKPEEPLKEISDPIHE